MSTSEQQLPSTNGAETDLPAPAALSPSMSGDPAVLGLPLFIVGAIALGLQIVGFAGDAALGAPIAIILLATGLGLVIAALWAAAIGQSIVACVFGTFAGFWLSYGALVLGLTHGWFAIAEGDVRDTVAIFQISWAITIGVLTIACLRLPLAFTVLNALVVLALVILAFSTLSESPDVAKLAGYVVLAFAAVGIYIFLGSASTATGGKPYGLGKPVSR